MSYPQQIASVYNLLRGNDNVRYVTYPDAAAAVSLPGGKSWAYGAWTQLEVAATFTTEYWLCGLFIVAAAVDSFEVDLGIGTAPAGATRATLPWDGNDASGGIVLLPILIRQPATTGVVARLSNASAAAANTLTAKVIIATGL